MSISRKEWEHRRALPYGIGKDKDGRTLVFDRLYKPLAYYEQSNFTPLDGGFIAYQPVWWLYSDVDSPQHDPTVLTYLRHVADKFPVLGIEVERRATEAVERHRVRAA